jgi:tryptophan 2,3-dioxygenase
MNQPQYYSDYLALDTILNAQHPVSFQPQHQAAHDEMLFIIIHQAYELWFKQLLFETESVIDILQKPSINDNSPELQTVVHRIGRINTILKVLVHQVDIMETMTPMDFLDFRDLLRPASGFQSVQFKLLEARLGLPFSQRHEKKYYTSSLRPEFKEIIEKAEHEPGLLQLLNKWLERIPFLNEPELWANFTTTFPNSVDLKPAGNSVDLQFPFWPEYRHRLLQSLADVESANLQAFDQIVLGTDTGTIAMECNLTPSACRAALFIMLYRGYPVLQLPFQLINAVLETDELLSTWRYRHMNMVHRMIGHRVGTGGSTGQHYLKGAADKHYIFKDFALLTSFLIERRNLPLLTKKMETTLGFSGA